MYVRLIYISRSSQICGPLAVQAMAAHAAEKNAAFQITGVLVKSGNYFIQVLEGAESAVLFLYNTIKLDRRHCEVRLIYQVITTVRAFDQWSMGCINVDAEYYLDLLGYRKIRAFAQQAALNHSVPKEFIVEMLTTLTGILEKNRSAENGKLGQVR